MYLRLLRALAFVTSLSRPLKYRRVRLKVIEAHIRSRELKARKSVTMAQVAGSQDDTNRLRLVAWMDVVHPGGLGSSIATIPSQ